MNLVISWVNSFVEASVFVMSDIPKVRVRSYGPAEVAIASISSLQGGADERCTRKVGSHKVGATQIGMSEAGAVECNTRNARSAEFRICKIGAADLIRSEHHHFRMASV